MNSPDSFDMSLTQEWIAPRIRFWYVRAMIKNLSIQIDRSGTH